MLVSVFGPGCLLDFPIDEYAQWNDCVVEGFGMRNKEQSAWIPWSANFIQFLLFDVVVGGEVGGENSDEELKKREASVLLLVVRPQSMRGRGGRDSLLGGGRVLLVERLISLGWREGRESLLG